jgi:hypothetical protein
VAKSDAFRSLLRPISEAPVKEDEPYGPCLLTPGRNGRDWVIGEWDGKGWHDLDNGPIEPTHYLLLPERSELG